MKEFEAVSHLRMLMCALGYHRYHPSAMEFQYIRNEGKYWVYEVEMYCSYCGKTEQAIFSLAKPIKENNDAGT